MVHVFQMEQFNLGSRRFLLLLLVSWSSRTPYKLSSLRDSNFCIPTGSSWREKADGSLELENRSCVVLLCHHWTQNCQILQPNSFQHVLGSILVCPVFHVIASPFYSLNWQEPFFRKMKNIYWASSFPCPSRSTFHPVVSPRRPSGQHPRNPFTVWLLGGFG